MNLSRQKLSFLTETLPKMKFSEVIRLAMEDGADLQGYLNIRKAGQRILFGAQEDEANLPVEIELSKGYQKEEKKSRREEEKEIEKIQHEEDASSTIPALIDEIAKKIKSKYEPDSRIKLEKAIGDNPEKNKIMQDLKSSKFVKPGAADSKNPHKAIRTDIENYLKEAGLSDSLATPAENWISLMRMAAGYLDTAITGSVMGVVHNKMKSNLEKESIEGTQHAQEAASFIVAELLTGRNIFESLDRKDKDIGAAMILSDIKSIGSNLATSRFQEFKKEEKDSPKKIHLDMQVDSGEGGGGSLNETIADPSSRGNELEKRTKTWVAKRLEESRSKALENYKSKTRDEDHFKNILHAVKQGDEPGNDFPAGSDKQFTQYKDEWEKRGISTKEQWRTDIKNPLQTIIRNDIQSIMDKEAGKDWEGILISSKLSHQLLIRAISNGKIILASKISSVSPCGGEGNVKVFEKERPQFAHEFYWKIDEGNIHIAEVEDVDEDHMNEAYQSAFEAIQQEALMNNIESQYSDKPQTIK